MSPTLDAFVRSWPSEPWLVASLLLSAAIYFRGWNILRHREPQRWNGWRLASFLGGRLVYENAVGVDTDG